MVQVIGAASGIRVEAAGPEGAVLLLVIDNPPLNALGPAVRAALAGAIADAAPGRPVVIAGAGRMFSAATLIDQGDGIADGRPSLAELCLLIENHSGPVVAAVAGRAVGPGAELALAAHARVAGPWARFIFPGAGLGLPPEAGASQRLPRLVGAQEALEMLLRVHPVGADEALAIGLADHLADEDVVAAAIDLALSMTGPRPVSARNEGLSDVAAYTAAIARARAREARNPLPAPARIVDCVEAALCLPPANGYALEAVAYEDLAAGEESQGLIAAARAERRASVPPEDILRADAELVTVLGLNGSIPQQAALALMAVERGLRVIWSAGPDPQAHAAQVKAVTARMEAGLREGRLSREQYDADLLRLESDAGPEALGEAGLILHAGPVPAGLVDRPGIVQLFYGGGPGPGLLLAPSGRIAELGPVLAAAPGQVATAIRLLRHLGLPPVLTGGPVGIGRAVTAAGRRALALMAQSGVPVRLIARALEDFGEVPPELTDTGVSGTMRAMTGDEVRHRWLAAMANEGYRLLAAGVALRPSDIDHILIQGHGFPRWRGGPMYQAARRGPMVLRADLRRWQSEGDVWTPHPVLDELVSKGRGAVA
ncbi:enoyl-CoA hydratase-related protein [Pseudogemmobacter humi]|uniref:Putative enoyl-CoA hydratase n=1 Tax=Pseudogemmobacter humi TaxID=2483812 RepID=A0A3P5XB51_9RHOB|nr:enoyl-CoA hydratase-related protein [Pseudogemmobacter humi]VDC31995.1 putative enoyl-CoA hydratase [Pseudogemmobacter humi]